MKNRYTVTELKQGVQRYYLRQLRQNKQLLIVLLEVDKLVLSYWQKDCCMWNKEIILANLWTENNMDWWQEGEKSLREALVWAKIKDMADTLLLVDEALVQKENLSLPTLTQAELLQALAWEAEQVVPWEKGSFVTAFMQESLNDMQQVRLWAWQKQQIENVCAMANTLRLQIQAILVGATAENTQQEWYAGENFQYRSLLNEKEQWRQRFVLMTNSDKNYVKTIFASCLLLSVVIYGSAQGGRLLAQKYLHNTEQQLEQYTVWQQRYEQSQKIEAKLRHSQLLVKNMQQNASHISKSVSNIGQQVGRQSNCWLEFLHGDAKTKEWQLTGSCYEGNAVNNLVERLENSQKFSQVKLKNMQQEKDKVTFTMQLKEK